VTPLRLTATSASGPVFLQNREVMTIERRAFQPLDRAEEVHVLGDRFSVSTDNVDLDGA
jgi:hypothetical protein